MIGTQLSPAALTGSTVAEAFPNIKMIITIRLLFFLCQSVPPISIFDSNSGRKCSFFCEISLLPGMWLRGSG